jgi:integrase
LSAFISTDKFRDPISERTSYHFWNKATGEGIECCDDFILSKVRRSCPKNSVDSWVDDLRCFFNYFFAASESLSLLPKFSATALAEVISAFPLYLAEAGYSSNIIAREAAKICSASPQNIKTAKRRISTLKALLQESARHHEALATAHKLDLINFDVAPTSFLKGIDARKIASERDKQILRQHSVIAGLIRGGPRYVSSDGFRAMQAVLPAGTSRQDVGSAVGKAFPADSIIQLLEEAPSYRDRALWALLAGTGIRTHEALQLLFQDVDPEAETVLILPYHLRIKEYGNNDREKASNKRRATEEVYFLSPFKEIFFDALASYLKTRPPTSHNFLFVNLSNNSFGEPMWKGRANGHNYSLIKTQKKMGFQKPKTLHSLRHFYGVWVLNFVKHSHGYGFDLATVQKMMGHSAISSTEVYAIRDRQLVAAMMSEANNYLASDSFDFAKIKSEALLNANSNVRLFLGQNK